MKTRWLYLAVGAVITLFLGLIYAWSLFVTPIEADLGFTRAETALTFSISISCFSIGNLIGGVLLKKVAPRVTMILAAIFIAAGFIVCTMITSPIGIFLSYGVVLSVGVGFCYITVLNLVNKWFPDKVGTASGTLLMGFGLGGFVLGGIARSLFEVFGWRATFIALAVAFALIIIIGAFILKYPSGEDALPEAVKKKRGKRAEIGLELSPFEMIRRPVFWIFFIWLILMTASGLAIIGNAATFAENLGATVSVSVLATGVVSICNGLGRLLFGTLFDLIGRKLCMLINSLLFVAGTAILLTTAYSGTLAFLFVGFACVGLAYGGVPTTNSALTMSFFGSKSYAVNFSIMALSIIPAALLGPYLSGLLLTYGGGYAVVFLVMLVISALALFLGMAIRKPEEKQKPTPDDK